jgi:hypothetical protein
MPKNQKSLLKNYVIGKNHRIIGLFYFYIEYLILSDSIQITIHPSKNDIAFIELYQLMLIYKHVQLSIDQLSANFYTQLSSSP